jgi:hypothetical protein
MPGSLHQALPTHVFTQFYTLWLLLLHPQFWYLQSLWKGCDISHILITIGINLIFSGNTVFVWSLIIVELHVFFVW